VTRTPIRFTPRDQARVARVLHLTAVSDDDVALLARWSGGDRAAGSALVGRHYASVLRFFQTKAGPEADDLTQRTFLRCAEAGARFRGDASVKSFLFGIARNVLYEHIRANLRDKQVDPDFSVSSVLDLNPRASTLAFRRAEQRRMVLALQQVPLDTQIVLELFYWEELSVDDVARVMDLPAGTVKSRLHRGREQLREALERIPSSMTA
jgi:RNA polymerase sigma-70 factor (ECF subfamily)